MFPIAYLQRIHIDMFGQLFDWPGQVRDVDTAAGDTGIVYARPQFLDAALDEMFTALKRDEYLLGVSSSRARLTGLPSRTVRWPR